MEICKKYITKFCQAIDQLTEVWTNATDNNYNVFIEMIGGKANYFAIKLGLTSFDEELPFDSNKWRCGGGPKGAKEQFPKVPDELQVWKKKAEKLSPDTKLVTIPIETNITKAKIEKFIRTADDAMDIQNLDPGSYVPGPNQAIVTKGRLLNNLALELGLIDPDWYLAKKCELESSLDFKLVELQEVKESNRELYKELQIDANCCKLPFIVREPIWGGGYIDEDRLQPLVVKAEALLDIPIEAKETSAFNPSPDFRNITAALSFALTEDQAECIKILWKAKQEGIDELTNDYILVQAGIIDKNMTKKMSDVFKKSKAWNTLIVQGSKRGHYRLGF